VNKELDEIYSLYAEDVYRFIYKLSRNESLSQDILQNTMLKAVISFDKFKGECSIKTWLCTIARNEYYNHVKRAESKNMPLEESAGTETIEDKIFDSQQAFEIHQLLHRLDEPYKEVFTLRVFAELKFSDIGRIFEKSENWARVTFFRAKEKIIDMIDKED